MTTPDVVTPAEFRVLLICTGNICRSPVAEQVLRDRLRLPGVVFASAGTAAVRGARMTVESAALSTRMGGEPAAHRARDVEAWMIADADLVLAMSREHRAAAVRLHASAHRRTFTLRELARLVAETPGGPTLAGLSIPDALRAQVPRIAARRGAVAATKPEDDDIPDPYQRGRRAYERAGRFIDQATASVAADILRLLER